MSMRRTASEHAEPETVEAIVATYCHHQRRLVKGQEISTRLAIGSSRWSRILNGLERPSAAITARMATLFGVSLARMTAAIDAQLASALGRSA